MNDLLKKELDKISKLITQTIAEDTFPSGVSPECLASAVRAYPLHGGKRLRPALLMWSCGALGGFPDAAVYAATAVEIYHSWTLVHDDIIDEDNMRRYFSAKEGGEEIIDDIEHRVAELLSELQTAGATAINIENVQDIIRRIGNPEQFDDNEADGECPPPPPPGNSGSSAQDTESNRRRRLFRDPQDAMIGGINSGLAHFLNIENPAILRLLWVVLFFLSGSTAFFLYLILWIVVPAAVTPEERLRMKGQPVNPQTLNEEIIHAAQDNYGTERSTAGHSLLSRLLDAVLKICALLFKLLAFLFLGLLLVVAISIITLLVFLIMGGAGLLLTKGIGNPDLLQFGTILNNFTWETCAIAIGCFIVVALPLMALYRLLSNGNSNNGTGRKSRIAYLIVWIASLIITLIQCLKL